jgi:hypothetical protein
VGTDPITDQTPEPTPIDDNSAGDGVPSDNTTLVEVLAGYDAEGFSGQFSATEDGMLRCYSCHKDLRPSRAEIASTRRLEGASDPDDMLMVLALNCPHCGTAGTAVIAYGPESTPGESELLLGLEEPGDAVLVRPESSERHGGGS